MKSSWFKFDRWLDPAWTNGPLSANDRYMPGNGTSGQPHSPRPTSPHSALILAMKPFQDPETLTQAHRNYLAALKKALLLHDITFATALRRLMTSVDHLSGLKQRLDAIQRSLHSNEMNENSTVTDYLGAEGKKTSGGFECFSLQSR